MASPKTVQIAASTSDAHEYKNDGSGSFVTTGTTTVLWSDTVPTSTNYCGGGWRFTGLAELVGQTILSAILELYVISVAHDDMNMKIHYDDVDNSPAFVSGASEIMVTGRTHSAGYVEWVQDGVGTGFVAAPNLKTILQTAIDAGKLASGVWTLLGIPNTDVHKQAHLRSYDDTTAPANTWGAKLTVTYGAAANPVAFNAVYVESFASTLLQTPNEVTRFLSILDTEVYDRVYLNLASLAYTLGVHPEYFTNFISQCANHEAEVFALLPYSASTSVPSDYFAAIITAIITYNKAYPATPFTGIIYDCEPPAGTATDVHNTFIASFITSIQADKAITVGGSTIVTLDLTLAADIDSRWGGTTCDDNFLLLCAELDYFEAMTYADSVSEILALGTAYGGGAQGIISLAEDNSIPFSIVQETEEWGSVDGDKTFSWYAQGYGAHKNMLADLRTHYAGTYPTLFSGVATYNYSHSVSDWHLINGVVWPKDVVPQTTYAIGESISVEVNLRTSDNNLNTSRPYGVKLEIYNPSSVLVATYTDIIVMTKMDSEIVTFSHTIPVGAPAGKYKGKITTWDLDLNDGSRSSMLYYSSGANGWNMGVDILNYDMVTLAALTTYNGRAAAVAMRVPFLELQSTGLIADIFTVYTVEGGGGGGEEEEEEEEAEEGEVSTVLQTQIRAELADTGTLFTTAIINQAIRSAVADISRISPRERLAIKTLNNLSISNTPIISDEDAWVYLVASTSTPLDRSNAPVVTDATATTTYVEFTDYLIDYVQGRIFTITAANGGSIGNVTSLLVSYHKSRVSFGISDLTDLIRIDQVMWLRSGKIQEFDTFQKWGNVVWLTTNKGESQANFLENDQFYVWYFAEHTVPDAASGGSYPAYMDDVVVKGAVAYALFAKHRECNLQAITDAASSRTALAVVDDDQTAIDALITATETALLAMRTALGTIDAEGDALIAAITTALGKVETHAGYGKSAADLINAELLLANAALDKLTTHLADEATTSAVNLLKSGDDLIDTVPKGLRAPENYNEYAQTKIAISREYYEEALGRVQHGLGLAAEVEQRIATSNAFNTEGEQRINKVLAIMQTALAYGREAELKLLTIDKHLSLGSLYLEQSGGYLDTADRAIQVADRFLVDARDRHNDYWIHLTSRIESAKPGSKTSTKQLPV